MDESARDDQTCCCMRLRIKRRQQHLRAYFVKDIKSDVNIPVHMETPCTVQVSAWCSSPRQAWKRHFQTRDRYSRLSLGLLCLTTCCTLSARSRPTCLSSIQRNNVGLAQIRVVLINNYLISILVLLCVALLLLLLLVFLHHHVGLYIEKHHYLSIRIYLTSLSLSPW